MTHEKFKDFIGYRAKVDEVKKETELSRSLSKGRQVQAKSTTPRNQEISQERRVNSAQGMNHSGRGQPNH